MAGGASEISSRYPLAGIKAATMAAQENFIQRAKDLLAADDRVLAAYLVGGFAIGKADPWSDVDLQVVVTDEAAEPLKTSWPALAARLAPLANVSPSSSRWAECASRLSGFISTSCSTPAPRSTP